MERSLLFFFAVSLSAAPTPKGFPAGDWQQIRALHDQHRHAVVRQADGTLAARNSGQQWKLHFDGRGFTAWPDGGGWTWGLELQRFGLAGSETPARAAHPGASANRVSYQRGAGVEEWFVNDGRGLEQGFTVARKPQGSGDTLVFDLALRGSLLAQVHAQSIRFSDGAGRGVVNFGGLKAWDADGRVLKAAFEKTAIGLRYRVETKGARYPVTVDPLAQQAYLKASNTEANDDFGRSVAISGDTVVVGAPSEDSNATGVNGNQADNSETGAGAAYVFVRTAGVWSQQAYLKASNPDSGDSFGGSVAISGDTVVVGATGEDSSATGVGGNEADNSAGLAGAAYVFRRNAGVWSQEAYLKASNTSGLDTFGNSVAISGDTVVVGATGEDSSATGVGGNEADNSSSFAGAAYVFRRSAGVWSQEAYLKASNTNDGDQFGSSVAISGDTVVVGATGEDSNATGVDGNQTDNSVLGAGAAYVFWRTAGVWSQQAYLKASNTDREDQFGISVAISGDTLVVGANLESSNATGVGGNQADNSARFAGAAYVFARSGVVWSQQAYLKASNTDARDEFGWSVAISGDTVVVGAYREASNATGVGGNQADNSTGFAGAAYVFRRTAGVWSQEAYLKASNTGSSDQFGWSVAISGDTVVVAAPFEDSNATGVNGNQADNSATNAGAAYVFTIFPGTLSLTGGSPQSAVISTAFGMQFQVTVRDPQNNPIPNVTVAFTPPNSGASGTFAGGVNTAVTNASGIATAPVFTANGTAGVNYNVVASIVNGANTVNFVLTNIGPPVSVTVVPATNGQSARVIDYYATALQAKVSDSNGIGVPGVNVTFSAGQGAFDSATPVTTDANGIATASPYRAGTVAGPDQPRATLTINPALFALFSLTTKPGSPAILSPQGSPQSTTVGTTFANRLSARVTDVFGNPVPGILVSFQTNGAGTLTGGSTGIAGVNGVAESSPLLATTTAGNYTPTASMNTPPVNLPQVTAVAGPATDLQLQSGSSQSAPVSTAFAPLVAKVVDTYGNPVQGASVAFTAPVFTQPSCRFSNSTNLFTTSSGLDGLASALCTANQFVGSYQVSATLQVAGAAGRPAGVRAPDAGPRLANVVNFALQNLPNPITVTVVTNLTGPTVTANAVTFTGTRVFTGVFNQGDPFTITTTTPQLFNGGQSQYVFLSGPNGNANTTQTVNLPFQSTVTYTMNFKAQHQVTFNTLPAAGGTINPAGTAFYDQGAVLSVLATPAANFVFAGFTGLLGGPTNPQTLTVTAPGVVTANFIPGDAYQLRYMSNLNLGDSVINLTNTGARGAGLAAGTTANTIGAICANVYAFSPDEQMISCCSCPVTPNGLVSLSARGDLISNTLTPAVPTSIVVKLLGSIPDTTAGCNNSASTVGVGNLAPGLLAWGTTVKADAAGPQLVETRFVPATLSIGNGGANIGELGRLQQLCSFINANGSGFGVCRSCRLGGLGAGRQ